MEQPSIELLNKMLSSGNRELVYAAMNICEKIYIPQTEIRKWMMMDPLVRPYTHRLAAMRACRNQRADWDIVMEGLNDPIEQVRFMATDIFRDLDLEWDFVKDLITSSDQYYQTAGLKALRSQKIAFENIRDYLYSRTFQREFALEACLDREVPEDVLWDLIKNQSDYTYDIIALTDVASRQKNAAEYLEYVVESWPNEWKSRTFKSFKGVKISLDVIEKWLNTEDRCKAMSAILACKNTHIPYENIASWMDEGLIYYRLAAIAACLKNPCIDILQRGIDDEDQIVRAAAMSTMRDLGLRVPACRVIEPPDIVYKKCVNDVIITAKIPKDAQIRGNYFEHGKYRSDKAEIIDIFGDVCGEEVAISKYDNTMLYSPGDFIFIKDFDYGHIDCSQGFHFFLTRKEAEEFRL